MNKFEAWQESRKELGLAKRWLNLLTASDSQSGNEYKRISRLDNDNIQLCGQSSAGATNYHRPGPSFYSFINKYIEQNFNEIMRKSFELMEKESKEKGENAKSFVEGMLTEINE